METEIELKFFVSPQFSSALLHKISTMKVLKQSRRCLENVYFDTPDLRFRQHDMGLRVRRFDDVRVQTLKTAGRVVAGLHQRPEYNVEIDHAEPNLCLHPDDAWPEGFDVAAAQQDLTALFSTDFERQQWLIALKDGSQIELAFDQGEVRSGDRREPICEVELELISGQPEALFTLARTLCDEGGMRLGNLSKAARGYRLAFQTPPDEVRPFQPVPIKKSHTLEQAFVMTLEHALAHWHRHEQIFVDHGTPAALDEMQQGIMAVRQSLTTFGKLIPRRASSLLRQELQWLEGEFASLVMQGQLSSLMANKGETFKKLDGKKTVLSALEEEFNALPSEAAYCQLLSSGRYCELLLDLSRWILNRGWVPFLDEKSTRKLQGSIKPFAVSQLERSWHEIFTTFRQDKVFDRFGYLDQRAKLQRQLLAGVFFGALFPEEKRQDFRLPWRDLLNGMEELLPFELLIHISERLPDGEAEQMQKWLTRREDSLLLAMTQSQRACLESPLYWA